MKKLLFGTVAMLAAMAGAETNDWYVGAALTPDATHFTTLQAAINALVPNSTDATVIHLAPGTYRERVTVSGAFRNVTILGDLAKPENYVISWNDTPYLKHDAAGNPLVTDAYDAATGSYTGKYDRVEANGCVAFIGNNSGTGHYNCSGNGTGGSYALGFYGDLENIEVQGVTILNTATDEYLAATEGASESGQSVAVTLYQSGTPVTFRHCRIMAYQDTLCTYAPGYFEDTLIRGEVDYIFGGHACLFNRCELQTIGGGHITAGNHDAERVTVGYLFWKCRATSVNPGRYKPSLGRTWYSGNSVWFVDCSIDDGYSTDLWGSWGQQKGVTRLCDYGTRTSLSLTRPNAEGQWGEGVITSGSLADFWTAFRAFGYNSIRDIYSWEQGAKVKNWKPTIHPAVLVR